MVNTDNTIMQQVNFSANAMFMLNSSCQGIVETYINPSSSAWYAELENDLVTAQRLVRSWRTSGALYFNQYILENTISCGQKFQTLQSEVNAFFDELIAGNNEHKIALISDLINIKTPIDTLNEGVTQYETKLKSWGISMEDAHQNLINTVAKIQNQEASLQADIDAINAIIIGLQKQIQTDKEAIAKAQTERTRGTVETIFGVIFAPFTGGLSLILAGIGVASIADAESKIAGMQVSINNYQGKIVGDQGTLTDDQKQITTLNGLTMSTHTAIDDMNLIDTALDALRTMWQEYSDNLEDVIKKIHSAESSSEYIVGKAWFSTACAEWKVVVDSSTSIKDGGITTSHVVIGTPQ